MQKQAIRSEIKVTREHGSSGPTPYRNTPTNETPTGGVPLKASNAWMQQGNGDLERFAGGEQNGSSEDYAAPPHPGQPGVNAKQRSAVKLAMQVLEKHAAKLRVDQVLPKKEADRLLDDLDRERRDLMGWVQTELALGKTAASTPADVVEFYLSREGVDDFHRNLKASLKQAGEENEPTPDQHASAPAQHMRPRAEVIIATPKGVYGIDKGDYILFPGGGIDDGEPAIVGAIRETIEESDIHVLNIDQKDVVESVWPENSGNDFWDDSDYSGERTYFFNGIYGGTLGTRHADREDFEVIPFETLVTRLKELIADSGQSWAKRNNEVRLSLVEAAQGMSDKASAFKPKKLAAALEHTDAGWGKYRNSLRRVFMPPDPDAFAKALQRIGDESEHHADEVRRFPNGGVLVVLRTHDTGSVTAKDHALAKKINGLVKRASIQTSGSMALTLGADTPSDSAPGLLVDIDDTIVDSDWDGDPGVLRSQKPRDYAKKVLETYHSLGVRIIGVTNRSGDPNGLGHTPEDIQRFNEEVMGMFPELVDIVYCADYEDQDRKPSPAMLEFVAQHFKLDPILAMVGDSDDDLGAAAAAGLMHFGPHEFFERPEIYQAVLALATETEHEGDDLIKVADVASLMPRNEFVYLNDEGNVLVRPGQNRRFEFPTQGSGRRAPYSNAVRVIPEEGVEDPGYHGYEYNFNLGSGDAPEDFEGGVWMPAESVLKQMYGSMGLAKNKPHRQLDRARARVIHRAMKKIKGPQGAPGSAQAPRQVAMEGDRASEGGARPEEPTTNVDLPAAVTGDVWRDRQRAMVSEALGYVGDRR